LTNPDADFKARLVILGVETLPEVRTLLSLVEQLQQEREELIAAMSKETFASRRTMRVRMEQAEAALEKCEASDMRHFNASVRLRTALEQIRDCKHSCGICDECYEKADEALVARA
jgi:hypothetical protein